jgi:hypothetical protein
MFTLIDIINRIQKPSLLSKINSEEFKHQLILSFDSLNSENAGAFFNLIPIDISEDVLPTYLLAYEKILKILKTERNEKYEVIHKGSPFYFLGIGSFLIEDYERSVFYMDAALSEDLRSRLKDQPAQLFFKIDTENTNQLALPIVIKLKTQLENHLKEYRTNNDSTLQLKNIIDKILENSKFKTISSAFLSYTLEYETRRDQILITPMNITGEPFILHFLKGCVLLESLLNLISNKKGGNLGSKLDSNFERLGLIKTSKKYNLRSSNNIITDLIKEIDTNSEKYNVKCFRTVRTLRDIFAHNIEFLKPKVREYKTIFDLTFGAICIVLESYIKQIEKNGVS